MENHPIPQDVTGFQFKLIGSMTVKQFAYILIGVILAIILYYLPLSGGLGFIIKTFFIPLFGAGGLILAFVPIEGRPIDIMLANFIKALFAPNQFVYQKTGQLFSTPQSPTPSPVTRDPVKQTQPPIQQQKTQSVAPPQPVVTTVQQTVATTAVSPPIANPQQAIIQTADNLAAQEALLAKQLNETKKILTPQEILHASSVATQKVSALERQVNELHFQREQLEQQLQHLQKQLAVQKQPATPTASSMTTPASPQQGAPIQTPPASPTTTPGEQSPVRPLPQAVAQKTGLPHVPDTANVIAGIVKDPRGNVLPNMLVEVKDIQGNPVRAFKTNALGQFASATPLAPGEYTVELEDPKKQNTFDIIQLHATNQILLPIEIISHDAREELRKQLFN
ncbi:MAG TPA: PrgI family protein [Patescibacteria group bacterium]|nr:PrgI family protein [Patescibacteria group bacterium]